MEHRVEKFQAGECGERTAFLNSRHNGCPMDFAKKFPRIFVDTIGVTCDETIARVRRFNKGNQVLLKTYRYCAEDVTVFLNERIKKRS